MNIQLVGNWFLRSDTNNFMIIQNVRGRDSVQGYYSNIETAIQGFFTQKLKDSNAQSIHTLLCEIKSLQQALAKALQPLNLRVVGLEEVQNE